MMASQWTTPLEVFYSYAPQDEDLLKELDKYLAILKRERLISTWHARQIGPGLERRKEIDEHLNHAHIILLLVSPDFIASPDCYEIELPQAMERRRQGEARVIPILLRSVGDWKMTPFGALQALPMEGKPVTSWSKRGEAFDAIARGIREVICDWADENRAKNGPAIQQQATENVENAENTDRATPPDGVQERLTSSPGEGSPSSPTQRPMGAIYCTCDLHSSYVVAVAWEPDGKRIASAGGDGVVRIWDAGTGQALLTYRGHTRLLERLNITSTIYTVAWSPDGTRLASAGNGSQVLVWDAATGQDILAYSQHSGLFPAVFALTWSPDGTRIASACSGTGWDKTIHVWSTKSGDTLLHCATGGGFPLDFSVLAIAWSPNGKYIVAGENNKKPYTWDAVTGKLLPSLRIHAKLGSDLAWSPDGRFLAIANSDRGAQVWDMTTGTLLFTYLGHVDSVRAVAWSPDGTRIASASNDTTVQIWDAANGKRLYTYRAHRGWVTSVAWSPDGTCIASASNDKTVQVWQAVCSQQSGPGCFAP